MAMPTPIPIPRSTSDDADWDFEDHEFTVELFLKPHAFVKWAQLFGQHSNGNAQSSYSGNGNPRLAYYMDANGALGTYNQQDGYSAETVDEGGSIKQVLTLDAWNHVVFARSKGASGAFRMYVNGSMVFEDTTGFPSTVTDGVGSVFIGMGRDSGSHIGYLNAHVDNLRVSKSVALYPTHPFPNFVDNPGLWTDHA